MEVSLPIPRLLAALLVGYVLFFFGLTGAGLLGPDEPRYASIGREMAHSGDWVTPALWGTPWFEKPPLLYWMVAIATRLGLSGESAARAPVALLSVAFLGFYHWWLARQFSRRAAWCATAVLATSAGWLSFSQLSLTDLPLAATFSAAMLLCLPWAAGVTSSRPMLAGGVLLGLAVLAKGLVPLVLALPLLWIGRRKLASLAAPAAIMLATATPWYLLAAARHGRPFLEEFFWRHHFQRFTTTELQHVQPFWFFVPVLLAGLFPWTPLLFARHRFDDPRRRFLLSWLAWGFVFFSISTNKLPGYLLPVLPAAAAMLGLHLAEAKRLPWLASCALLLAAVPVIGEALPPALESGLSRTAIPIGALWYGLPAVMVAALAWRFEGAGRRGLAIGSIVVMTVAGVLWLKLRVYPDLDARVSARAVWRQIEPQRSQVCLGEVGRSLRYGLGYYSEGSLSACADKPAPIRVVQPPRGAVLLTPDL